MSAWPFVFAAGSLLTTLAGASLVLGEKSWGRHHLHRFLAFGSGVLLGVIFLHVLPEAWRLHPRWAGGSALTAFILFFVVEQFTVVHPCSELLEDCRVHSLSYGAFAALALHSFADGLAMAFSFLSSETLGLIVSSAVLLHKLSDGLTLSSLLVDQGLPRAKAWALTGALSAATPVGVFAGISAGAQVTPSVLAVCLGLAAGGFLYVSAADILPRIHKSRDSWSWILLLLGISASALWPHH